MADAIGKKILVVDDDGDMREFVEDVLVEAGFEVASVADSPSALAHVLEHPDLDLVITDIVMPNGMNGRELGIVIRAQRPGLKIIYMSGYTPERPTMTLENEEFIAKPFRPRELLGCVYELLGRDSRMRADIMAQAAGRVRRSAA